MFINKTSPPLFLKKILLFFITSFPSLKSLSNSFTKTEQSHFKDEKLNLEIKDYYFSNVIARASKTMLDCKNSKLEIKKTGTEG